MTDHAADWLNWQREHTEALSALQEAQHDYHRRIAGSAFSTGDLEAFESNEEALRVLDRARMLLDEVRDGQPK